MDGLHIGKFLQTFEKVMQQMQDFNFIYKNANHMITLERILMNMKAQDALLRLQQGNRQYVQYNQNPAQLTAQTRETSAKNGQQPYAVVVACSDSRIPVEHIFSAGIGELFIVRTAGNVLDAMALGSITYGIAQCLCPLVLVMGHTNCGAVAAALQGKGEGHIQDIIQEIQSCFQGETNIRTCEILNVKHCLQKILNDNTIASFSRQGMVSVQGAMYDIASGKVDFWGTNQE